MKYLIQNRKEFAISVGFFIMTAVNLIKAIKSQDVSQDLIVAVIYAFFGVLAWFYNMPTSNENNEITPIMREAKLKAKDGDMTLLDAIAHAAKGGEEDDSEDD